MIVNRGGRRTVRIRRRDPTTLERIEEKVSEYYPYFFVQDKDAKYVSRLHGVVDVEKGYEGVYGEPLSKVIYANPSDYWAMKDRMDYLTWEGNIPFTNRVLGERVLNGEGAYPKYEHKIWYLDMEWKTDTGEITIITVRDSYTNKDYTWFTHADYPAGDYNEMPCLNHPDGITTITFDTPIKAFSDEKSMLKHFVAHLRRKDPDIIAGWFVVAADIKQLAQRMERNGLRPETLSPYNRHTRKYKWTEKKWTQPIPGRISLDLMEAFKKLWVLKNGQLPGQGLDAVANHCLGEAKTRLSDGHNTYYSDIGTYIEYNRQDVALLPALDELVNCTDFYISMQHLTQCDFETVPKTTGLATCLFLQDKDFNLRIPTEAQFEKVDYEAAYIQEPTPGLYGPTAIMDIRAMYHSNVKLHNICWTTVDPDGTDCGNGAKFRQDKEGLLGRTMDYLTLERDKYKALMKKATTDKERRMWDGMQFATKSMIASLYGVAGDSRYGLYNPSIAAAITYTSRKTLSKLSKLCESKGYPVCYQHTDSCFVQVPTVDEAIELTDNLNIEMSPIVVEFEKFASSLMLKAKNRYAGRVVWEGSYNDEPDYYIKGMELIQARMPRAMKQATMRVLKGILDGEGEGSINDDLTTLITKYVKGEDSSSLFIKTTLKRNLWDYKVLSGPAAGAEWAFHNLGCELSAGDDFIVALDNRGRYIGFPDMTYLPDVKQKATIGYQMMVEKFIVNKANDLYEIVGWDSQPLYNALRGVAEVEWI